MTAPGSIGVLAAVGLAGACAADEPATVTLHAGVGEDEGLRLADGAIVPTAEADLAFHHAMVMSLRGATPGSICALGTFDAFADVPAPDDDCAAEPSGWAQFVYLDACSTHSLDESSSRGLGLAVRDRVHQARYRVRVVGDAYLPGEGGTVVLEYGPLP